jgi:hypothetical protein
VVENRSSWAALTLFAVLFFIWPIAHTIALRNVLLFILALWLGVQWNRERGRQIFFAWRSVAWSLALFTAWLFVDLLFTPFWREALSAIQGQWLSALLSGFLGVAILAWRRDLSPRTVLLVFFGTLVIQAVAVDIQGLLWMIHHGQLPHGLVGRRWKGLTAGPDKSNYLTNMALDLLVAELSLRLEGDRFLPMNRAAMGIIFALLLLGSYLEAMRNGLIDLVILAGFLVARFAYRHRAQFTMRRRLIVAGIVLVVFVLIGLDLAFDHRWDSLYATIPVAWNTAAHRQAWLDAGAPLPLLPNGHVVSQSNYLRIAWIKEGFKSLFDFPMGLGYSRSAFGKALLLRFGPSLRMATSTNNGFLNLAVSVGFPGLILWYIWYALMFRGALARLNGKAGYWGRALFLVALDVGSRMLVDANMQDYMLEQFLFLVGFLGAAAIVGEDDGRGLADRRLPNRKDVTSHTR